ncbi:MAG: GGDEF domain-containing protein [Armatimonadetes bacterium]|nr:GGDEF domain-containing protein [Armatimonadota bacterium]
MKNLEDMNLAAVWVNPNHTVQAAKVLMRGFGIKALAILEASKILGIVSLDSLQDADEQSEVRGYLRPLPTTLGPKIGVVQAAQKFVDEDLEVAVVVDEDRFVGLVTSNMLLKELRRSWDPLTGLGWSDRLREWGANQLSQGQEITVLFIDLDDFGKYNKQYGHVVGDRVLKKVANLLKDTIDPKRDVLVRFGGDEFAIATLRPRQQAEDLGALIKDRSGSMFLEEAYRPITFSVGVAGGRRSVIRPDIHAAATFDELVNAASRDAQAQKVLRKARQAAE